MNNIDIHLGEFVYCRQHCSVHSTGWCTVDVQEKIALQAKTFEEANTEAEHFGLIQSTNLKPGKVFIVWTYTEGGDDHRAGPIAGVCSTLELAKAAAKGTGWYGGDGSVLSRKAIELNGKIYLLAIDVVEPVIDLDGTEAAKKAIAKQAAMDKLTDAEKALLGLK